MARMPRLCPRRKPKRRGPFLCTAVNIRVTTAQWQWLSQAIQRSTIVTTEVYAYPWQGAIACVKGLYELADEAGRIATKFKSTLDVLNTERARADAMTREIDAAGGAS